MSNTINYKKGQRLEFSNGEIWVIDTVKWDCLRLIPSNSIARKNRTTISIPFTREELENCRIIG